MLPKDHKESKCPERGAFPQEAETVHFKDMNALCRLGDVAIHQSSSIKLRSLAIIQNSKLMTLRLITEQMGTL